MPKQVTAKKKLTKAKAASKVIKNMTGGVVADQINVKGNWIQGDQFNYRQQIMQITTPQQFIAEAEKMQAQIAAVKKVPELPPAQKNLLVAAEANLQEVVAEAKKDHPNSKNISDALTATADTITGVGKTVSAVQGLMQKITQAVDGIDLPRLAVGAATLANLAAKIFMPH